MSDFNFCSECAGPLLPHSIAGENRKHLYCPRCLEPRYDFPMVVVTSFVACGQKLLWVQRELEPQRGKWAIPGGFLENNETLAEGAARELREEAGVDIPPSELQLYMTGTITFINQVYVGFRAKVDSEFCSGGLESMDCRFLTRDECPWEEVAYPQVNDSILQAYSDLETGTFDVWQAEMTSSQYDLRPVSQQNLES